jgi:hypothetical protein
LLAQLGVHRESLGDGVHRVGNGIEHSAVDAGCNCRLQRWHRTRRRQVGDLRRCGRTGFVQRGLQATGELGQCILCLVQRDVTAADQRFRVELAHAAAGVDEFVHLRLRVTRLIAFVVTEAAVTHHVDDNVLVELLTVRKRELGNAYT